MAASRARRGLLPALSPPDRKHRLAKTAKRCFKSHNGGHLLEIGRVVFGVTALADGGPTLSLEVDRGSVKKHQGQVGEQVSLAREQVFLNEVLDSMWLTVG